MSLETVEINRQNNPSGALDNKDEYGPADHDREIEVWEGEGGSLGSPNEKDENSLQATAAIF